MVIKSIFYQELSNCICASDLLGALNPPLLIYIVLLLITCPLDIVSILYEEILSWSLIAY